MAGPQTQSSREKAAKPAATVAGAGGNRESKQRQPTGVSFISLFKGREGSSKAQQRQASSAGPGKEQAVASTVGELQQDKAWAAAARGEELFRSGRWGGGKARRSARAGPAAGAVSGATESRPHWVPREGKYLLLFCAFGRMSNHMWCMRRSLRLAALLNRTLLVPPSNVVLFQGHVEEVYPTGMPVDWERMARCLAPASGPRTVMTFEDYFAKHGVSSVVVDKLHCAVAGSPTVCAHPLRIQAFAEAVGPALQLPPLSQYPDWLVPSPRAPGVPASDAEVSAAYAGVEDSVVCAGNMFSMVFELPEARFSLPRSQQCNNLWRPHKAIGRFVDGVIASKLGRKFAAFHLRR